MSKSLAIISHPFLDAKDGQRDLFIRSKDDSKSQLVPLYDHHEYDKDPIGTCQLIFIPILEIGAKKNICLITGLIDCSHDIGEKQAVSVSAPVIRQVGKYNLYREVLEVSLVDTPHLSGAAVVQFNDFKNVLSALYANSLKEMTQIVKDLNERSS
jgi:hypothetical protein